MTAVQWGTVLVVSICFLATANGHTLHNGARHKSSGLGPHQSFSPKYLNKNLVGSSHSVDVGNIGGGFKSKRDEDRSDVSAEDKTIDGIKISDDDDDDYDDDNDGDDEYDDEDEDYGDDKDYRENESDSDNDKYENEAADEDNTDGYLYDYVNDNGIENENNNENEANRDRFSREKKEVFGTQKNNNIPGYKEDDGHRDKNYRKDDDEDQDDGEDNDGEDDDDDDDDDDDGGGGGGGEDDDDDDDDDDGDDDDGEVEDDEHSSALEDENGAKAVADYIVDYIQSPSSGEQNENRRCLFGWWLNAKGACVPYRKECAPGLVRSEAGDCIAPHGGHYYK